MKRSKSELQQFVFGAFGLLLAIWMFGELSVNIRGKYTNGNPLIALVTL
jgi:hypothetical protein